MKATEYPGLHHAIQPLYKDGERMKFNTSTIEYVKTLRLCDVVESLNDLNRYYTDAQIAAIEALYKLVNPQHFEMFPLVDRTIKLETIVDTYIQLIVKPNGFIKVFEANER